ncbi:MAG TPA: aminodeoxychorismate lyase [Gammaproteobacteria bacterium]|nr:aminodeoxychorismate lyase [Gammaproteobacteria bacterium]
MLVNGRAAAGVDPGDRGLHYGDGVFETIALRSGCLCLWARHMARLAGAAARLGLAPPDPALLQREAEMARQGQNEGVIKILLTRGVGGRGYRPSAMAPATRIIASYPPPDYPAHVWREGVRLRWCQTRLARQPALAGLKHLNRLEQILARREWEDPDIHEGLMCDEQGRVIEGTMSNLFVVQDGVLLTPALDHCGVQGVVRALVLERAREMGWPARECDLDVAAVEQACELFVTNSLIGIWPVSRLGPRRYAIGVRTQALCRVLFKEMKISPQDE